MYWFGELVGIYAEDICISVGDGGCSVTEEHHDSVISFRIMVEIALYRQKFKFVERNH